MRTNPIYLTNWTSFERHRDGTTIMVRLFSPDRLLETGICSVKCRSWQPIIRRIDHFRSVGHSMSALAAFARWAAWRWARRIFTALEYAPPTILRQPIRKCKRTCHPLSIKRACGLEVPVKNSLHNRIGWHIELAFSFTSAGSRVRQLIVCVQVSGNTISLQSTNFETIMRVPVPLHHHCRQLQENVPPMCRNGTSLNCFRRSRHTGIKQSITPTKCARVLAQPDPELLLFQESASRKKPDPWQR